jgi:WD40 repeat protein
VGTIFRGHKGPVYTVAFGGPHNNPIFSAGLDRTVRIWLDGRTKELLESFDSGNTESVNCLALSPDGKTLAVGGEDHLTLGGPAIEDAEGNIVKKRPTHTARLFNVGSWKVRAVLAGHERPIRQLAFSPDGKLLATASDDRSVRLWNVADGKELAVLGAPYMTNKIRCLAFSPDGSRLATGGEQWATVWKLQPQPGMPNIAHKSQSNVFSIAFSPDGKILAFGCADGTIKLWTVP